MKNLRLGVGTSLMPALKRAGIELDQRMRDALHFASPAKWITESQILVALCRLNTRGCDLIPGKIVDISVRDDPFKGHIPEGKREPLESLSALSPFLREIFRDAISLDPQGRTLGATNFLRAILREAHKFGDWVDGRSRAIDLLVEASDADPTTSVSKVPQLQRLLNRLEKALGDDDYQYTMFLSEGRISFRVASTLGDYVQESDSGIWTPNRTLLTHFGGIGLFYEDQIRELEDLLNSPKATEQDFQNFFARNSHFLRNWDHREVYPHVFLTREDAGPLIPDFILTNKEAQKAAILDLKLPQAKLIRRQDNRVRFAAAVMEARTQLLRYRDWFEQPDHRRMLMDKVGMEIYRPRLMVVIGRASEFSDAFERQQLSADNPDIEIVTYDDIARHARDRMYTIQELR